MKGILVIVSVLAALFFLPAPVQAGQLECPAHQAGPGISLVVAADQCLPPQGQPHDSSFVVPDTGSFQSRAQVYVSPVYSGQSQPHPGAAEANIDRIMAEPGSEEKYHTVRPAETLAKIARNHETTLNVLLLANPHIVNPHLIYVGDQLRIPSPAEIEQLRSEEERRRQADQRQVVASTPHQGQRWVDVDLRSQTVRAYEGDTLVKTFTASTGTVHHPTVTGQYNVWLKLEADDMSGPGYFLKDVPYVLYFYKGYALHGTYWHNNFGTPMSHGCVNLRVEDAAWLFDFADLGTLVNVHE